MSEFVDSLVSAVERVYVWSNRQVLARALSMQHGCGFELTDFAALSPWGTIHTAPDFFLSCPSAPVQPWLTVRRVLWVVTFGWALCLLYLAFTVAFIMSIVFAPFAYQSFRMALLALDGGITLEPYNPYVVLSMDVSLGGKGLSEV
jgi:uncharacterized membrane protein YccF (DUF307 family)